MRVDLPAARTVKARAARIVMDGVLGRVNESV